jgi:hypothetical protein
MCIPRVVGLLFDLHTHVVGTSIVRDLLIDRAEIATAANHWRALGHSCATHKKDLANELMTGGKSFSFWHQADHADQVGYVGW